MNSIITLDGLVIFGGVALNTMIIPNSRSLTIVGGPIDGGLTGFIDNNDLLVMDSTGSLTELRVAPGPNGSTLSIHGSGELRMSDNLNNRMVGGGATIIFGPDQTVGGSGLIGVNQLTIINKGTIVADQTTPLVIDAIDSPAGGLTNTGLMVARKGATLLFNPMVVDNALGEIRAEDLSTVLFQSGAQITGGLMVAQSGGLLEFNGCTLLGGTVRIDVGGAGRVSAASSTVENLTNHGDIIHINTGTLHTAGQFNNTGNYFMSAISSSTDLVFDSDTVLDGGGTINMNDTNGLNRIYGSVQFTNVDNTIRGSGLIGVNQPTIINQGTIIADQNNSLSIGPGNGGMTNLGTLRAENGATLLLLAGFTTSGLVFAEAGSTVRRVATDYIQTAGSTIIDGILELNAGGTVTLNGGLLGGDGLVAAHVDNVAGTASPGSSAGTLTISGNYTQGINGAFTVELGGTMAGQFDVLAINNNATLAGELHVAPINNFILQNGDQFVVLTAASVTGVFDTVTGAGVYNVTYNPTNVTLTVLVPPSTADLSGPLGPRFPDGCVDAFDLGTLLGAWCSSASDPDPPKDVDPPCEGCTSPNFTLADISGAANVPDGCVDAFDLAKLLANWCSVAGGNPCGTCQ
ncbi:MAG: hypothetical protein O7C65_10410 [Planctomycetota bacterium]|nr:hypothetical protein [Planctomycetota bacterium]